MLRISAAALVLLMMTVAAAGYPDEASEARRAVVRGCLATYDGEPRTQDGRVDITRLVRELEELHCNTYEFLIWHASTDWLDLKYFLRATRNTDLKVWVCLVPPSESGTMKSEPFGLDYIRWAKHISHLSTRYPNLVAWSIDDFTHNLDFFTPEYLAKVVEAAHIYNPYLAFVPCTYFSKVTTGFAHDYGNLLDGLLFYYRHESAGANLTDPSLCADEIAKVRHTVGSDMPIVLGFYATSHSWLGDTTPEYVEEVMHCGHKHADGIVVYCHQKPGTPKYRIIKRLFRQWDSGGH